MSSDPGRLRGSSPRADRTSDIVPSAASSARFFGAVLSGLERAGVDREELSAFGDRAAEMIGEALARTVRRCGWESGSDLSELAAFVAFARDAIELASEYDGSLLNAGPLAAPSFIDLVRGGILDALAHGAPSLGSVARRVGASPRTVQRRLERAGTSFEGVLDSLRRSLAMRYLADDRIGIADVASRVGFSEPSAFYRAFRRWTGTSPHAYRATRIA